MCEWTNLDQSLDFYHLPRFRPVRSDMMSGTDAVKGSQILIMVNLTDAVTESNRTHNHV